MNTVKHLRTVAPAIIAFSLAVTPSFARAQSSTQVSSQDKQYLEEIAQDSNYEMKTSQLALQKSQSLDVKEYARMVNHDHTI